MAARLMGYVSASNTPTIVAPSAYGVATGGIGSAQSTGTLADGFSYSYLTFNSTGTLTVTTAGYFDYCAVGGGGGASNNNSRGGGGGGGQVLIGSVYLSANQTITIGAGGSFSSLQVATQGGNTSVAATSPFTQTALGNIGYVYADSSGAYVGGGQGSSGGGTSIAITESTANGYRGGNSNSSLSGGGGGGATSRGGNSASSTGGAGGEGFDVSVFIGSTALYKGMGAGGGATGTGGAAPTGGVAGSTNTTPSNGNANSGGGGGGGSGVITTGNGGSGICYIRFR